MYRIWYLGLVHCLKILILITIFSCSDNSEEEMKLFISGLRSGSGQVQPVYGCTDPLALNYNPLATVSDGSCVYAPEPVDGYLLIPVYGQSLSVNYPLPGYVWPDARLLQFSDGITGTPTGSSTLTTLAKENDTATNIGNVILSLRGVEDTRKMVFTTAGVSGASIASLSRGTAPYTKLIAGVTELKRIADAEGKDMKVPCVPYMQGEADLQSTNNFYYETSLNTLVTQLNQDIKAITGQSEDVILLITQMASHNYYGRYPRIALQQYSASVNNSLIYFGRTNYNTDYYTDNVHLVYQGSAYQGSKIGYTMYKSILKAEGKKQITIQSHTYSSLKSTIVFNVPVSPLVFDTTEVTPLADGNKGFKLFNVFESTTEQNLNTISEPAATITGVTLLNATTVEITYSANPTGSRLTYGMGGGTWNVVNGTTSSARVAGRIAGSRGQLRDSQGNSASYPVYGWGTAENGDGVVMFSRLDNWCPIFEIQL